MAEDWAESFVGTTARCLFERVTPDGRLAGYTDRYVPLTAPGSADLVGHALVVKCMESEGSALVGELVNPDGREP
jgi:hypothetical protein